MNWPQAPLSPSLAKVVRGVTFSQADASSDPFDNGVPVLRAGNIQERLITEADLVWVNRKFVSKEQFLQRNDIVVCTSSGSASLVGKSAILNHSFEGTWGAFNAVVRCNPDVLMPEYMAYWLSSAAFRSWKDRQVQGANIQNIKQSSLESIRVPLPSLPEQQRIVDVLQQAEVAYDCQSRRQHLDWMIKSALDHLVLPRDKSEWVQLGCLVETRYGTSISADATADTGVAVLRIPNVMGGEVDTDDLKYVNLTQAELKRLNLTSSDVLIVRSNGNPDYVGRSAPITADVAKSDMVYASYLIRLRTDMTRLLPEYLSAFLNSAYGRAAMRNAIRTTAGQSNLNGENLTKVQLPIPSIEEQVRFRDIWLQVRELRRLISKSEKIAVELCDVLSIAAMSGELTADWRRNHADEIAEASHARDTLLRERGTKIALSTNAVVTSSVQTDSTTHTERQWLLSEISEFQRQVLAAFTDYCQGNGQPLLVEDPEVFSRFCDDAAVTERLQAFGQSHGNRIRRSLSQLASLGLIAKITLPKQDLESGELDYLKAFRPLRPEEFTRMADVQTLRKTLTSGVDQQHYHFEVQLDYETSAHAGASGMFQVFAVEDEDGQDFTHLVNLGKHYASLDELKEDIASALKVEARQVDLESV
ncbi:restriction endonuclease subunit S [Raoultella ornithinolytica]|uniref:restriction endonuclease subunit S n=1 Tax=Enterobacteriaceae TaxID=543 RepID=UPI0028BD3EE2|nr:MULTISPECIES: restriction endonuclease subunit S [Enterobacteriaceae]MEB6462661.1 restriction endonuclease subunit S [Raoultella ornithinolytica]WNN72804.1 restriction endonuclease subunit S [Kluyvera cryocrescens]